MTTPPPPGPPPGPYSQQPSGPYGQPGPYGQQPYPAYSGAPANAARPGMVTAAAVLAFISGGLGILFGLLAFSLLSLLGGAYSIYIILALAVSAALIWGGVQALSGKDGRILVIISGLSIAISVIGMIVHFAGGNLIGLIIPILIIVFLLNQQSKAWIQSRGGKTF